MCVCVYCVYVVIDEFRFVNLEVGVDFNNEF